MKLFLKMLQALILAFATTVIFSGCKTKDIQKKKNLKLYQRPKAMRYASENTFSFRDKSRGIKPTGGNIDSTTIKLEGIITAVSNKCWSCGTCSIQVNNKWWVAIEYGKRPETVMKKERGRATGIRFTENNQSIGKRVKVYARIIADNKLTLEGSKTYYAEIIETLKEE